MKTETRKCKVCEKVKPLTSEYFNNRLELKKAPPFRRDCKVCYNAYKRTQPKYYIRKMLQHARNRARIHSRVFDITIEDISIPEYCPVLNIALVHGWEDDENCPTLERINNNKGYTPDNIMIVSALSNRVKNSATWQQIIEVGEFYKHLEQTNIVKNKQRIKDTNERIIIRKRMKELKK